jgi:hypothetical protein
MVSNEQRLVSADLSISFLVNLCENGFCSGEINRSSTA